MATKRALAEHEIREARLVFADALDYQRVVVVESWPWMQRLTRAETAFCLGNRTIFPRPINTRMLDDMSWLIHEMTHVWQFQTRGWVYLIEALWAQFKLGGAAAYNYGGQAGLEAASLTDASIHNFNPEQQGDIAKHYYRLFKLRRNKEAWEPFVEDIRRSRK